MEETLCCDICFRAGSRKLPFLCPTDARNRLYGLRLRHGQVLLEKTQLDEQVSTLLTQPSRSLHTPQPDRDTHNRLERLKIDNNTAKQRLAELKTDEIIRKADQLRLSILQAKEEMAEKRAMIARNKKDLEKARNGLDSRRQKQLDKVDKSAKMATYRWNQSHAITVQSKAFFLRAIAETYGLRQLKIKDGKAEYIVGGPGAVRLFDLKHMNTLHPRQINAGLGHISHLFNLACTYLAVRPPAEVVSPHADYPLHTVFAINSSYIYSDIPFPSNNPLSSKPVTPSGSKDALSQLPRLPRPRPLFIPDSTSLPNLARDDPHTYTHFLEAVCLLAYDIAWVCKTQGISIASDVFNKAATFDSNQSQNERASTGTAFDDMTSIGRNIWKIIDGGSPADTPSQAGKPTMSSDDSGKAAPALGQYSHGSIHTSLNSAAGAELVRGLKFPGALKIADQLKKHLAAEAIKAEWELVDEWKSDASNQDRNGAEPKSRDEYPADGMSDAASDRSRATNFGLISDVTETTFLGGSFASLDASRLPHTRERKQGVNGWTKLKSRPKENPNEN